MRQTAALPIQFDRTGKIRILMVTSRGTGRWVVPKGWLMDGKKPWHAAGIEALEEAGAVGYVGKIPLGEYGYLKEMPDGTRIPVRVQLYPMIVERLKNRWKERNDRTRRWFRPKSAARRVDEPELRDMLIALAEKPQKMAAIKKLLLRAA